MQKLSEELNKKIDMLFEEKKVLITKHHERIEEMELRNQEAI